MLVIISDLHLTDGTSGTTINSNAFNIFRERLKDLVYAASNQDVNGSEIYKPIDELHLLLLGDILDVIRSTRWLEDKVRPWDDPGSDAFVSKVKEITDAILANNQNALAILRSLRNSGLDVRETKSATESRHNVKVFIRYVCGNHDWFYHLPGPGFDAIRASVAQALGLSNDPGEVFPYDTRESKELNAICEQHQVFARHGDVFDSSNYDGPDRNHSSLGDAIVIELVDRFSYEVERRLGKTVAEGLKEIDNVRPLELIPAFVDGLLQKTDDPHLAARVRIIWNEVVNNFLKNDFVRSHKSSLKWGLKLSEKFSFHDLGRLVPWARKVLFAIVNLLPLPDSLVCRLGLTDDLYRCALNEPVFKDPKISYIVYGHTHHHEIIPLRSGSGSGTNREDIYLNSGTWRAVFELSKYRPKDAEFFAYHVMTYLALFKPDERKGKAFEAWSGSLEYPSVTRGLQLTDNSHATAAKVGQD